MHLVLPIDYSLSVVQKSSIKAFHLRICPDKKYSVMLNAVIMKQPSFSINTQMPSHMNPWMFGKDKEKKKKEEKEHCDVIRNWIIQIE